MARPRVVRDAWAKVIAQGRAIRGNDETPDDDVTLAEMGEA